MGLIAMSERDLQRIEVLSKVIDGRMTLMSAAHVLALSERQVRRLLERIRTGGAASIRHKAIGRPSNNRINDGLRDYALTLIRERYWDFGPTLAAEKLAGRDGLCVSRETLRHRMTAAGIWRSRQQRRSFHRHDCGARLMVSWCRSTAPSIAGCLIAFHPSSWFEHSMALAGLRERQHG
ncbi:ISNCY family insertion sequence transposase domain-containing protein [Rhizobium etli 8C-3]|uniref:ISNCY family insertion sequence transposase domain-containing protein n=1 Tax=Rhizobium etli 8C-3 TaxID=538025 RepID=A0A1L5P3U4_RHIET|nr:ISNCY family insertion sequence transposase domain-containing protein [Rhizobium etli 8C-3]